MPLSVKIILNFHVDRLKGRHGCCGSSSRVDAHVRQRLAGYPDRQDLQGKPGHGVLHLQRHVEADPQLQVEHERNRPPRLHRPVSRTWLRHFEAMKDLLAAHGRMPRSKGPIPGEFTLAAWLSQLRTEFRYGRIRPEMLELLGTVQDWNVPARTTADRQRWERRLKALKDFLACEQRWPRYRGYKSGTAPLGRLVAQPEAEAPGGRAACRRCGGVE